MPSPLQDPVFLLIAALLLGLIFFLFLLVRRTMAAFKEGTRQGKR